MILFVGQVGVGLKDREAFQEVDYRAFLVLGQWATEIDNAERIPESLVEHGALPCLVVQGR